MSRRRRFLLVSLAALCGLVAFAPMLARTAAARRFVAKRISEALGRPVEIAGLDAGWRSGVEVKGLVVRNRAAEFRDEPLLEARSVKLATALPSLVLEGADDIAIEGLVVRLEEQAGGRTNIDDLVAGLAKPPRPKAPRVEPRPIRFRLDDATVHLRRLVRRPQPRPVDPFREDPVVLPADEGLLVATLSDLDLLLAAGPGETTLDLAARVTAGGREGRAEVRVRLGADGPSGVVSVEGLDLALLRPFLGDVAGRVDVRIEGSPAAADVALRAEGLRAGPLDEAWAELKGRVRAEEEGVAFEALSLRTASDALSLDASGALPPRDLDLRARIDPSLLGVRAKGPLVLDARGKGRDLAGSATTPDLDARFDLAIGEKGVTLRRLDAKARSSSISLEGEVGASVRLSGTADVDLADLAPFLPEGRTLAGHLRAERLAIEDRALRADATVTGLLARGFFAEDLDIERGELHVDAALSEDRDTLTVRRAQLDGLRAEGTVTGLVRGELRADGTVQGTLELNPLHARLLGLEDVRGLRGQLTIDVAASTKGLAGSAAIEGLHVETARGTWDLARVDAKGSYADGVATLAATADGATLGGTLSGGRGTIALDAQAIERLPLLARLLPPEVALAGPLVLRADVASKPWTLSGTLSSARLTARHGARGVEGEPLELTFVAREDDRGWSIAIPAAALGTVRASLADGFLGRDGSVRGRLRVDGPLDRLVAFAPEARDFAPEGTVALDVSATFDGRWEITGSADIRDGSLLLSGERTPPKSARVEIDAVPEGTGVTLRRIRLATKTTEIEGAGAIGDTLTLRMDGRTRLEELAPFAPVFRGSGEVAIESLALDLAGGNAFAVSVALRSAAVRVEGGKLTGVAFRSRVTGRVMRSAFEEVKAELDLTASRAERGNILIEELVVRERGGGRSGAYDLGARVGARRVAIGATSWLQVGLDVKGRLDRLLAERPASGVGGVITFGRWDLGPFVWQQARGRIDVVDGNLVVTDLTAGLHGGTVRAEGRLVPADGRMAWEGSARAEGIVLSEEIGRPLSFVIPFLRVKKEAGTLSGRADFDLKLSADDTTDAAILRTLAGTGNAHLYEIEAKHSILLPLLSLRLDKAILKEPYRFKDLKVAFEVGKGKIRPRPFELKATPFGIDVKEIEVGLDGTVDALIVPGILPLRVQGTLDDPKVRPAPLAPFR